MRKLTILYVGIGLGVLAWILSDVDLNQAWISLLGLGWGALLALLIYLVAFYIDSISWHLAITQLPLTFHWSYLVWRVRMVGEAFNLVIPAGGFGGEPVKAVLLKRHHAVNYQQGSTSIILARTINLLALIVFMLVGLVLLYRHENVPDEMDILALGGFLFLTFGIGFVFAFQRFKAASHIGEYISSRRIGAPLAHAMDSVRNVESGLIEFYAARPKRFLPALALALLNWIVGALETYAIMYFLGHPISFQEAWMIESVAQMVRAVTFFIPANLGTQDGIFVILCGIVTGSPEAGVAVAAAKRIWELIFVVWGFGLGSLYSLRSVLEEAKAEAATVHKNQGDAK